MRVILKSLKVLIKKSGKEPSAKPREYAGPTRGILVQTGCDDLQQAHVMGRQLLPCKRGNRQEENLALNIL
jgi:hypothetical protein